MKPCARAVMVVNNSTADRTAAVRHFLPLFMVVLPFLAAAAGGDISLWPCPSSESSGMSGGRWPLSAETAREHARGQMWREVYTHNLSFAFRKAIFWFPDFSRS